MSQIISLKERNELARSMSPKRDPLPAPQIIEAINGVISYEALKKGLTLLIPYVDGMSRGDPVIVGISSLVGSLIFAETIKGGDQDELVPLEPEKVEFLQGQEIRAWYMNQSWPPLESVSPEKLYSVEGWLYDPEFPEAVEGVIPISVAQRGTDLLIRGGRALVAGAIVSLYFVGTNSKASFVQHMRVGAGDDGQDIVVPVSSEILEACLNGAAQVIYIVNSPDGLSISRLVTQGVEGEMPTLEPLYPGVPLPEAWDQMLPIDDRGRIPFHVQTSGMAAGDQITLFAYRFPHGHATYVSTAIKSADITQGFVRLDAPGPMPASGSFLSGMVVVERLSGKVSGSLGRWMIG